MWRERALELLPEFSEVINAADNVMSLWIDLHFKLEDLCGEARDEDAIARMFSFARWCMTNGSEYDDPQTAVSVAFYEHLPTNPSVRTVLRKYITREEFIQLKPLFQYFLSGPEYADFEREYFAE